MTTSHRRRSVLCALHLHHDIVVNDDNPENRRAHHLTCTRCGRLRDLVEYEPATGAWMGNGVPLL